LEGVVTAGAGVGIELGSSQEPPCGAAPHSASGTVPLGGVSLDQVLLVVPHPGAGAPDAVAADFGAVVGVSNPQSSPDDRCGSGALFCQLLLSTPDGLPQLPTTCGWAASALLGIWGGEAILAGGRIGILTGFDQPSSIGSREGGGGGGLDGTACSSASSSAGRSDTLRLIDSAKVSGWSSEIPGGAAIPNFSPNDFVAA